VLTPSERTIRARLAANARWANESRAAASERQRRNLERRFEDAVDPDRTLSADERARRAKSAQAAHMAKMTLASVKARKKAS
jgi:hypothetical protein